MPKTLTPCDRARGRRAEVAKLETTAKRNHTRAQAALDRARAQDLHPRAHLVRDRDAASKALAKRRAQLRAAERAAAKACEARPGLTPRGRALRWMTDHRGTVESPAGSNRGGIRNGRTTNAITEAQVALAGGATWLIGTAWCGTWCAAALRAAGVQGITTRLASVAFIEDDARAGRGPFRAWTRDPSRVLRGDLVVIGGRGVHVEMVREVHPGYVITDGGNTSPGNAGSQSNGGGSYRRIRSLSIVHGFALVDYPDH